MACDRDIYFFLIFIFTLAGGWWFNACGENNLNGRYVWLKPKGRSMRRKGIHWRPGTGSLYSLKTTKISIRQASTADSSNWASLSTCSRTSTGFFFPLKYTHIQKNLLEQESDAAQALHMLILNSPTTLSSVKTFCQRLMLTSDGQRTKKKKKKSEVSKYRAVATKQPWHTGC